MQSCLFPPQTRQEEDLFNSVRKYFFLDDDNALIDDECFLFDEELEDDESDSDLPSLEVSNSSQSTSSLETNLSTGAVVLTTKPKRKRIYKKRKRVRKRDPLYIPRLLKRDLRRQFPVMMVNVFNSHDFDLIRSFFLTFGSRNMALKKNPLTLDFFTTNKNNKLFSVKDDGRWMLHGPQWIIYHWYILSRINPDQVIKIEESTIHTSSGTSKSRISFVLEINFTRIYDIEDDKFVDSIFDFLRRFNSNTILNEDPLDGSGNYPDPFDFYLKKTGATMPLLSSPQNVRMRAKASYYFDEDKHIEMVEIADAQVE